MEPNQSSKKNITRTNSRYYLGIDNAKTAAPIVILGKLFVGALKQLLQY